MKSFSEASLRLTNFRVLLDDDTPLEILLAKRLRLNPEQITGCAVARQAVDARRDRPVSFVFTLDVQLRIPTMRLQEILDREPNLANLILAAADEPITGQEILTERPVIVGFGPAGMLAALILTRYGYRPLVLERGPDVDQREKDVAAFWTTGKLESNSNVQFGEGGAGTFSDGKLTTRVNDSLMGRILEIFVAAGAPPEIRSWYKPHIGTDRLRLVVKNIRQQIIDGGGEIRFNTCMSDIGILAGAVKSVTLDSGYSIPCNAILLGIGHSARDTYAMLQKKGVALEAKPFAIGVRIEHHQAMIDKAQFGPAAGHPRLGAADYSLVFQDKSSGRAAYSFCMCPGGAVIAASSESGGVTVNGMSAYRRASGIANSALVVTVSPDDFSGGILGGVEFQRRYEQLAYTVAGSDYRAPAQTVGDFLQGMSGSTDWLTFPSYRPGVTACRLDQCLPEFVSGSIVRALPDFGRKIKGFDNPRAVLTGVETRTSAPVRILRGSDRVSTNTAGLYPMGEGAGYAGGIMSAALDGMNTALALISRFKPLVN